MLGAALIVLAAVTSSELEEVFPDSELSEMEWVFGEEDPTEEIVFDDSLLIDSGALEFEE